MATSITPGIVSRFALPSSNVHNFFFFFLNTYREFTQILSAHRTTHTGGFHSRGEGRIVLGSQVVGVQVEHANHEGHKHHDEDDHELEDVFDGAPQRDLQWAKAFVGGQDVGDAGETQHHGDGVQAL